MDPTSPICAAQHAAAQREPATAARASSVTRTTAAVRPSNAAVNASSIRPAIACADVDRVVSVRYVHRGFLGCGTRRSGGHGYPGLDILLAPSCLDIDEPSAVLIDVDPTRPTARRRRKRSGERAAGSTGNDANRFTGVSVPGKDNLDDDDSIRDLSDQGHLGDLVALAGIVRFSARRADRRRGDDNRESHQDGERSPAHPDAGRRIHHDENGSHSDGGEQSTRGGVAERGLHAARHGTEVGPIDGEQRGEDYARPRRRPANPVRSRGLHSDGCRR